MDDKTKLLELISIMKDVVAGCEAIKEGRTPPVYSLPIGYHYEHATRGDTKPLKNLGGNA